jgi:drug/metabolite transporter (DMT)-like permease
MSRLQALFLLLVANVLWGSSHAIGKLAIDSFDPLILAGIRVSIATACFWGLRFSGIAPREGVPRRDILVLCSLGLLTVACAQFFDYRGLSLTTATDSSLMIIGEVICTTVLAWVIAREFIAPQKRFGLVLGIVGVVVLTLGGAPDSSYAPNRALGNTFVILALLCESIFTVLGVHYVQRFQPLTILRWTYTGSMLVWAPVLWWAYSTILTPEQRQRAQACEFLDELEEWKLIMQHYCIVVACTTASGLDFCQTGPLLGLDASKSQLRTSSERLIHC